MFDINNLLYFEGKDYPQEDQYQFMEFMIPILLNAYTIVETGLGEGVTARIFLAALSSMPNPESRILHTVELYSDREDSVRSITRINECNFSAKWRLHTVDSVFMGHRWVGDMIDFLYLDSDHAYGHVLNEINAWSPHLKSKCIVMVEDTFPRPWNTFTEQQRLEILSTRNHGEQPCDPHWVLVDFIKDKPEWRLYKFTYPEGKTLILRGF